ncbi:MAG: hypothetical protein F4X54_02380 [Chloroflexi bacterium]|nr:hypothetical protein [Chloroflexota bacterium]MYB83591.1 hypothetical protein [Chloroflexota bacterium]
MGVGPGSGVVVVVGSGLVVAVAVGSGVGVGCSPWSQAASTISATMVSVAQKRANFDFGLVFIYLFSRPEVVTIIVLPRSPPTGVEGP